MQVAPHAGAWIEIVTHTRFKRGLSVAPHAGAWIEIVFHDLYNSWRDKSLPTRERGLKSLILALLSCWL